MYLLLLNSVRLCVLLRLLRLLLRRLLYCLLSNPLSLSLPAIIIIIIIIILLPPLLQHPDASNSR